MKIIRITREYTSDASEAEIARATLACIHKIPFDLGTALNIWQRGTVSKSNCCAVVYDIDKKEVRTVDLSYWLNRIQQLEYETVINCEIGQGIFSRDINDQITNKATYCFKKNPGIAQGNYRLIAYVMRGDGEIADNCELMKAVDDFYRELKAVAESELELEVKPEPEPEPEPAQLELEPEPEPEQGSIWATADRKELAKRLAEQLAQDDKIQATTLNKILAGKKDGCGHIFAFLDKVGIIKYIPRQHISIEFAALILTFAARVAEKAENSRDKFAKDAFYSDIIRHYHKAKPEVKPEIKPGVKDIGVNEMGKILGIAHNRVQDLCYAGILKYHAVTKTSGARLSKGNFAIKFNEDEVNSNISAFENYKKWRYAR